jgi:hypothetical protein
MNAASPSSEHESAYLVFGDLHGRILPAFRLATVWAREHGVALAGILQVGDLGYFPDPSRLDRATLRHAVDDPLELGAIDLVQPNPLADAVFADRDCPPGLWFTAGNHEDFDELERLAAGKRTPTFFVDRFGMVSCVKDGEVATVAGLRVGAVWGVDGAGPSRRTNLPPRAYIRERAVNRLLAEKFDVLLCHDAPMDAKRAGYGSELLSSLIELARPKFAFFGHYKGAGSRVDWAGGSEVHHLAGFELRKRDGTPEPGSVGLLRWHSGQGRFEYLPDAWLRTFSRHNWKHR